MELCESCFDAVRYFAQQPPVRKENEKGYEPGASDRRAANATLDTVLGVR
jgi:hypothetical protein